MISDINSDLLHNMSSVHPKETVTCEEHLKEVYHRVKNDLQIIQSLLRMGSRHLDPEQKKTFEMTAWRISAVAHMYSLLYAHPVSSCIDFKIYLENILRDISVGFADNTRNIRINLEAESFNIPLNKAVPLAFITLEIVTNAYKHAFPTGKEGIITITAKREKDQGIFIISDNGVGFPESPSEFKSSREENSLKKKSLGLTLIPRLAEQINAELESPKAGESTYRLFFPIC